MRQVCCSSPSSKHLTDNSAAIHDFPKNLHCTIYFFHAGAMFRKTVEFLSAKAVSNSEKQKKCTESIYLQVFQMKLYWMYTEVIQDVCNH